MAPSRTRSGAPVDVAPLAVERVTKRYGSMLALDQMSFQVTPGRVTGFLGPNGAGKSTTMRIILGLDSPTQGRALVAGRPYRQHHRPLHEIGSLLEARSVHPGRSAFHHLLCLAHANAIPSRRVHEVLELVGLASVATTHTGGFSSGMSQRLGIAQALLGDPPIVMLDEPINGLDPEGIRWLRTLLHDLAAQGRTVFVSSHLLSEMALLAEHLIVIGQGRLIADTTTEDFVTPHVRTRVRVRTPHATELVAELTRRGATVHPAEDGYLDIAGLDCAAVGDIAAAHQLTVHELFSRRVSLEDAFMERTRDSIDYHAGCPTGAP